MSDVISLRRARKTAQRLVRERTATENRVLHGLSKLERQSSKARGEKASRELDQRRITPREER